MSCEPCPEGTKVKLRCNGTISRTCVDCPDGTFSDRQNNKKECQRCQRCRRKELLKTACTKTTNTICVCRPGYIYRPNKPCLKCAVGLVAKDNVCRNTTETAVENTDIQAKSSDVLIIAFASGVCVVIFILIIISIIWYRRRGRQLPQQDAQDTPDVLKNIKTPPLPPKMSSRRRENAYGPAPQQVCRPLVEKKIISRQLPFSLVHDMNILLSTTHQKNYRHLAGELGYSYAFVKSLGTKSQPLETLMDDYMSSPNPTKEKLYEALVAIGRTDVAQMVWDEL